MFDEFKIEPNFSIIGPTYRQWKVDYDPLSDECIARGRTHDLFLAISGLVEEIRKPSERHYALFRKLTGAKDHPSSYWYGKIPILMVEPYGDREYEFDRVAHIRLPKRISPYGTCNGFKSQSLLCASTVHKNALVQIKEKIQEALPSLPDRYFVSEEERDLAKSLNPKDYQG